LKIAFLLWAALAGMGAGQQGPPPSWEAAAQELKAGHYDKAEEAYRKIIAANPSMAEAYINLGVARYLQRKYDKAIEAFAAGRKLDPHLANGWLLEGMSEFNLGRSPKAMELLKAYTQMQPEDAQGHYYLGLSLLRLGRNPEASKELTAAKQIDPRNVDVLYHLAHSYLLQAESEKARDPKADVSELRIAYEQTIGGIASIDPNSFRIRQLRATYDEANGEESKAIEELEGLLKNDPKASGLHYTLGCLYARQRRYHEALTQFESELRLDAPYPRTYLQMGHAYVALHEAPQALERLREAVQIEPENGAAWVEMGRAYEEMGQYQKAVETYQKGIERGEDTPSAYLMLGTAYRKLGKLELARQAIQKSQQLSAEKSATKAQHAVDPGPATGALSLSKESHENSPDCTIPFFMGLDHYRAKQLDQSIIDFSSAAACNPSYVDAKIALGDALVEHGDDRRALEAYEAALKLRPDDPDALRTAARLYLRHELNSQAVPLLQRLVQVKPHDVAAEIDLGTAYAATGQFQKAERELTEVRRTGPHNPEVLVPLAAIDLKTNRARDAVPLLLEAAHVAPDQYKPHYLLGSAYNRTGEFQSAAKELELAAKLDPTNSDVQYQLAQAYNRLGLPKQYQTAMARFGALKKESQEATESPEEAPSLLLEAEPLARAGKFAEAIDLVKKALSLDPGNDAFLYRLASFYYDAGQYDLAGQSARQAIAKAPSEWVYHYLLGLAEERTRQAGEAGESFETSVRLNPGCAECYSHLGELAMQGNSPELAIKDFERAVQLEPGKSEYKLNLELANRALEQKPRVTN